MHGPDPTARSPQRAGALASRWPTGPGISGLAPAAGAAVFGLWAGTIEGGAVAAGAAVGYLLLLGAAFAGADRWRDPLALGRAGRLLPWALWLLVAASAWASPVPRAGRVAVAMLPAFLLVPAAVARAWRGSAGRRWGAPGIAAVVAASALWGLGGRFLGGDPRASAPVGHHLLLAVWLLALLPVAALPAVGERGWRRWLGGGAAVAGAAALVATESLAGWAGLGLEALLVALVGARRRGRAEPPNRAGPEEAQRSDSDDRRMGGSPPASSPRRRRLVALAAASVLLLALFALAAPRVLRIVTGDDPSAGARAVYARAAVAGAAERPALGWGPGSAAWTAAEHLRPVPGISPPGEVVAELHSLPLQIAYELGWSGLILTVALAGLFGWRRAAGVLRGGGAAASRGGAATAASPGPAPIADRALTAAGLIGLAGAAVALLATGWLAVTALPVALGLAAGAALAGAAVPESDRTEAGASVDVDARDPRESGAPRPGAGDRARIRRTWPVLLYVFVAAVVLAPLLRAHQAYDRAVAADSSEAARAALGRAVRLDPAFPLYRAWRAWAGEGVEPPAAVAAEARAAAEGAGGLAALWLAAGVYGADAGEPWAAAALDRACDLDPLGALGPFHRMAVAPESPVAPEAGARALLAAPPLAAATFWETRPELLATTLGEALAWDGVDPGWRQELVAGVERLRAAGPPAGETVRLALVLDPGGSQPFLPRAFRRRSRTFHLAPVTVRAAAAAAVELPPATELGTSLAAAFAGPGCGAPALSPGGTRGR